MRKNDGEQATHCGKLFKSGPPSYRAGLDCFKNDDYSAAVVIDGDDEF